MKPRPCKFCAWWNSHVREEWNNNVLFRATVYCAIILIGVVAYQSAFAHTGDHFCMLRSIGELDEKTNQYMATYECFPQSNGILLLGDSHLEVYGIDRHFVEDYKLEVE